MNVLEELFDLVRWPVAGVIAFVASCFLYGFVEELVGILRRERRRFPFLAVLASLLCLVLLLVLVAALVLVCGYIADSAGLRGFAAAVINPLLVPALISAPTLFVLWLRRPEPLEDAA